MAHSLQQVISKALGIDVTIDVRDEFADRAKLRAAVGVPSGLPPETVSISHSPKRGGFAKASVPVGFDIEEVSRVRREAVARISTPGELESAPSPALLWCAKEAGFKLARTAKLVSDIHVGAWQSAVTEENLRLWSCKLDEDPHAIGIAVELSGTAYCIFVRPST